MPIVVIVSLSVGTGWSSTYLVAYYSLECHIRAPCTPSAVVQINSAYHCFLENFASYRATVRIALSVRSPVRVQRTAKRLCPILWRVGGSCCRVEETRISQCQYKIAIKWNRSKGFCIVWCQIHSFGKKFIPVPSLLSLYRAKKS